MRTLPAAAWFGVLTTGLVVVVPPLAGAANALFAIASRFACRRWGTAAEVAEGNAKLQGSASVAAIGGRSMAGLAAEALGLRRRTLASGYPFQALTDLLTGWGMAQQVSVTISCDICGSTKDAQTHTISLGAQALQIDLCGKDGRALDKVASKYVPFARKVKRTPATGRRTVSDRERSAEIRAWAKTQGFQVSDRGRIPENVEREYAAAH
jgi:hypothetical protein